ncbi:MAG: CorA family divalent cation transporter [Chloroflexota bacterium]
MNEVTRPNHKNGGTVRPVTAETKAEVLFFQDLATFSQAVETATGVVFDFSSLTQLLTPFLGQPSDQYLIVNVKDCDGADPDNLLFLTQDKALLFDKKPPPLESFRIFEKVLTKPFGRATILAFLTLTKVLDSFKQRLESLIGATKELQAHYGTARYPNIAFDFEHLNDDLEEFHDLLLKLQERGYKQVETRYISFDYSVLIAESLSLQGRCRRRLSMLKDLARDNELRASNELNKRIEKLNDVVKRLTAVTVILMLPTLIASHFGMNFAYMPELSVPWAYPAVIISQIMLMGAGVWLFWKIGWL